MPHDMDDVADAHTNQQGAVNEAVDDRRPRFGFECPTCRHWTEWPGFGRFKCGACPQTLAVLRPEEAASAAQSLGQTMYVTTDALIAESKRDGSTA